MLLGPDGTHRCHGAHRNVGGLAERRLQIEPMMSQRSPPRRNHTSDDLEDHHCANQHHSDLDIDPQFQGERQQQARNSQQTIGLRLQQRLLHLIDVGGASAEHARSPECSGLDEHCVVHAFEHRILQPTRTA